MDENSASFKALKVDTDIKLIHSSERQTYYSAKDIRLFAVSRVDERYVVSYEMKLIGVLGGVAELHFHTTCKVGEPEVIGDTFTVTYPRVRNTANRRKVYVLLNNPDFKKLLVNVLARYRRYHGHTVRSGGRLLLNVKELDGKIIVRTYGDNNAATK